MEIIAPQFDAASIQATVARLTLQQKLKRDFIYPAKALSFTDDGKIHLTATQSFRAGDRSFLDFAEAEAYADAADVKVEVEKGLPPIELSTTATGQLLNTLGLPLKFRDRLTTAGHHDLYGHNVRELLARDERRVLLRTLPNNDGSRLVCRAVLSDRYRMIDNADLFFAAAETFMEEIESGKPRAQVWSARLWDDGFEVFAFAPHISGAVTTDRTFDPGDGWRSRWYGNAGDVHNAAMRISNSETGRGGCNVAAAIMRRVCANYCVWGDKVTQVHLGKREAEDGLILSTETRRKEAELVWLKIKDAIRTVFDADRFQKLIDKLNGITQQEIKPEAAVDAIVGAFEISEKRKALILGNLLMSGDASRFGLVQAVTDTSHALDRSGEAEEASRLEEIGGELVTMDDGKFAAMVGA